MENRDSTAGAGDGSDRGKTEQAKDKAAEMKDKAQEKVSHAAAEARDRGEELVHEGKAKARSTADQQKERVSEGIRSMADALRRGGSELSEEHSQYGGFLNTVADRAEGVSRYLDQRDVDSLTRDARRMAREHTPVFLSGAFTLGMLGARFLKSSGDSARTDRYDEYEGSSESYQPGTRSGTTRRYGSPSAGTDYGRYQPDELYQGPPSSQSPEQSTTGRTDDALGRTTEPGESSTDLNRSRDTGEGGYA